MSWRKSDLSQVQECISRNDVTLRLKLHTCMISGAVGFYYDVYYDRRASARVGMSKFLGIFRNRVAVFPRRVVMFCTCLLIGFLVLFDNGTTRDFGK